MSDHTPPDDPASLMRAALEGTRATAAAADDLSAQIERVQADRRRDKRVYVALLATVLASVLVIGGALWLAGAAYVHDANRRSAEATIDRKELAAAVARVQVLSARIDDCISSSGKCYQERTASRYGDPTGPVNTVIVLAAACAQQNEGDDAILACVRRKLAASTHAVSP